MPAGLSPYGHYYGDYVSPIQLVDFSAKRKFAQSVISPFLPPIDESPFYAFARAGGTDVLQQYIPEPPPAETSAPVVSAASGPAGAGSGIKKGVSWASVAAKGSK